MNKVLASGILFFTLLGVVGLSRPTLVMADNPPNFVFFLVDDLRFNGAGAAGHPYINTPHIDRIADEGIRFTSAFVTTSLCGPSRHCFLTGKYARTTGAQSNGASIDWSAHPSFAKLLKDAGYQTAFIGKSHMGNLGVPVPGFSYWAGFPAQGVYFGTPDSPIEMLVSTDGTTYTTETYTNGEYNTDLLTDYAENWLDSLDDAGPPPPFCMCLWYKAVHDPRTPANRHANLYAGADFAPMTPAMTNPVAAGKPPLIQNVINAWLPKSLAEKQTAVSDFARKDARTLAAVDESVEDILAKLTNMGVLDSTVIVFASDNGYFFKDFGLGDKRWSLQPSIRIPWFVRYPPMVTAGRASNLPILSIDLAPTFLDLAGVDIPSAMQGLSFKPILQGTPGSWRTSWFTEYFIEANFEVPTQDSITMDIDGILYKYIRYPWEPLYDELYDLGTDSYEITNAIGNPSYAAQLSALRTQREQIIPVLTPTIPDLPYIELGMYNHDHGIILCGNGDGRTLPVNIGGREARKTIDPTQDHYMYFAVRDEWAYKGNRPDVEITIDYYDIASGSISLQYDSSDFAYTNQGKYKSGGSVAMTGTNTWKQHIFHVTDAYFRNRQNAGADFRINMSGSNILYMDKVQISGDLLGPPAKATNPDPDNAATNVKTVTTLSWTGAPEATSYDVYFGKTSPGSFRGNQSQTSFVTGSMDSRTIYFWRIDSINEWGTTTGDVWSFTTATMGDFDTDGDVDLEDFGHFQACIGSSGVGPAEGCQDADLGGDADVDQDDFSVFLGCLGGADQPPGC